MFKSNHLLGVIGLCLLLFMASCGPGKHTARPSKAGISKRSTAPSGSSTRPTTTTTARAPKPKAHSAIRNKYASELGVSSSQISNTRLYSFVDDWRGVRYRYGGMSKSGVDCSGFSNLLYKDVYSTQLKRTTREIAGTCRTVSKSNLKEGDFVFFDIRGKKNSHMGVYLSNGHFVHASSSKGVVISRLDNPYYQKYFSGGGRLR